MNPAGFSQVIRYFCMVVGLSMVAGWWVAFRNRRYLGLMGASFLTLAVYLGARERVAMAKAAGVINLPMTWLEIGALVICVALFIGATMDAVQESRRRLAEVREHFQAAVVGFMEMMEAEQKRRAQQTDQSKDDPGEGKQA